MQQLYLVEVFVDKISMFSVNENEGKEKKTKVRIKFGEDTEFIFGQGRQVKEIVPDYDEIDENERRKWSRHYRSGSSILFASYPDTMTNILNRYPLEVDIWTDVENEQPELIGVGRMQWHTEFFVWLKETANTCKPHIPLTSKEVVAIMQECCCFQLGEAYLIVRIVALGGSIITDFQQIMAEPDKFVFKTEIFDNIFQCVRVEGDNAEYNLKDHPFEIIKQDPKKVQVYERKIEVCTELDACKFGQSGLDDVACKLEETKLEPVKKTRVVDRIQMKDIKGPCGNPSCVVAHRVKNYIRNMPEYKRAYNYPNKTGPKKICGECACAPDRFHAEPLTDEEMKLPLTKKSCGKCMGKVQVGESCQDKIDKHYGTGFTPPGSTHKINCLTNITRFKNPLFHNTYVVNNLTIKYFNQMLEKEKAKSLRRNLNAINVNKNCGSCNLDFFRHLNKEHKVNIDTPIPNLPSSFDAKSSVNSLLVEFNGGFVSTKKQSNISYIDINGSDITTRSYVDQIQLAFARNDDNVSLVKGESAISGGYACSKQKRESMFSSNKCCCSKRDEFVETGFRAPVYVKPSGGCGCSKQRVDNTVRDGCQNDPEGSPQPSTPHIPEKKEITLKNHTKSVPEIRFVQVDYRRRDLVSPVVYNAAESSKNNTAAESSKNNTAAQSSKNNTATESSKNNTTGETSKNHPCTTISNDKECKCNPPIPSAACNTLDCNCITETLDIAARRAHKPYCPKYKHKKNCPVTMKVEEDQAKPEEEAKEEEVPLPYGLPPIQLGPCPVLGRPCVVPDGFARMYKNAADVAPQPPSYSEAGKVCCSKEYERIKKALNEYMKEQKERDMRCINKYNIDTEKRCCDKEQALLALIGKTCCGSHKMELQEKYKEKK